MSAMDSDSAMRLAAFAHIRQLLELRDALTASDLAAATRIQRRASLESSRMPLQYAEKINAARSGVARAAAATGRDESVSEEG
jgi:hypothetical protein